MKASYYWRYTNFPLNHDSGRKGILNYQGFLLLMEEILRQLIGSLSHYFQGSIHPRWLAGFLPSTVSLPRELTPRNLHWSLPSTKWTTTWRCLSTKELQWVTAWMIIPVSKWSITMVSKSPNWGCSPSKWLKWLINGGY